MTAPPSETTDPDDAPGSLRSWPPAERSPALDLVATLYQANEPLNADAVVRCVAADVVVTPPPQLAPVFKPYFGVEGVRQWIAEREQLWPGLREVPERYAAAGDHVVVLTRLELGDRDDVELVWLWSVRDGQVTAVRAFRYASEALVRLEALASD